MEIDILQKKTDLLEKKSQFLFQQYVPHQHQKATSCIIKDRQREKLRFNA